MSLSNMIKSRNGNAAIIAFEQYQAVDSRLIYFFLK